MRLLHILQCITLVDLDLDLAILEPGGNRIDFNNPRSSSSGKLDIDANRMVQGACKVVPGGNPVENISWDRSAPAGVYNINVNLYNLCSMLPPGDVIAFTLIITQSGQPPKEIRGEVSSSRQNFTQIVEMP